MFFQFGFKSFILRNTANLKSSQIDTFNEMIIYLTFMMTRNLETDIHCTAYLYSKGCIDDVLYDLIKWS